MRHERKKGQLWKARPYREGDEHFLLELYEVVTRKRIDLQSWKWLFHDNPAGEGHIWLADHKGRIIGQYAIIPMRIYIHNEPVYAMQSLDTMTHPDYRKKGIFITLARIAYEYAEPRGFDLVYGFPNNVSLQGFLKHLDFFVLDNLKTMTRPINSMDLLSLKMKNRIITNVIGTLTQSIFNRLYPMKLKHDKDIRVEKASRFPKDVDNLLNQLGPKFKNFIIRDWQYLNWRYVRNPSHSYHIFLGYRKNTLQGYCVTGSTERKNIRIGLILDLFTEPNDKDLIASLISCALEAMLLENMALASCALTSKSPFLKIVKRLGFIFSLRNFPYILRINPNKFDPSTIQRVEDWHITFGDTDFA